jgi:hypothetical protein
MAVLLLSTLSGIFYRMGGSGNYSRLWRMIGCTFCAVLCLLATQNLVYTAPVLTALALFAVLNFASLTTYYKKKGTDARALNWACVGLGFGLAGLPLAWAFNSWLGLTLRTVFLVFTVTLWSESEDNVVMEEFGRGFLLAISIPILFIT